mmetsp:Transcript_95685/g.255741  ORF Transcript_95685/g.255741 Transcript_95685/m.255741 type:complete len:239 (-) Transcript_95685:1681-2397(-)
MLSCALSPLLLRLLLASCILSPRLPPAMRRRSRWANWHLPRETRLLFKASRLILTEAPSKSRSVTRAPQLQCQQPTLNHCPIRSVSSPCGCRKHRDQQAPVFLDLLAQDRRTRRDLCPCAVWCLGARTQCAQTWPAARPPPRGLRALQAAGESDPSARGRAIQARNAVWTTTWQRSATAGRRTRACGGLRHRRGWRPPRRRVATPILCPPNPWGPGKKCLRRRSVELRMPAAERHRTM